MKSVSISNYSLLQAFDDRSRAVSYGCRQKWYSSFMKRISGCAPTAFSNLVWYFHQKQREAPISADTSKAQMKQLMEDIWRYITPAFRGVPSATFFVRGASKYLEENIPGVHAAELVVPPPGKGRRPEFSEIIAFLENSLLRDLPVAFLCLDSGDEKSLDSWHWTTIFSLEYNDDFSFAQIELIDDGKLMRIDLLKWFSTTSREGGFAALA